MHKCVKAGIISVQRAILGTHSLKLYVCFWSGPEQKESLVSPQPQEFLSDNESLITREGLKAQKRSCMTLSLWVPVGKCSEH